jgi:hypothetical protein
MSMFDRQAAIAAARDVLAAAPEVAGAEMGSTALAVDVAKLVDAVVRAGNPDALVVPPYDETLASEAWYRFGIPTDEISGRELQFVLHYGNVLTRVRLDKDEGEARTLGITYPDAAWHAGLALCSVAQIAKEEGR